MRVHLAALWSPLLLQGNFRAKKFDIVHVIRGKGQRVIASVKKESRFASGTAFLM